MAILTLPKDASDIVAAVEDMKSAAWSDRTRFLTMCRLAFNYLRGYRKFIGDYDSGRLLVGYETRFGDLKFRNEDIRNKYRVELGRFMKMDMRPAVKKKNWGLSSIRKSAMGQVALDYGSSMIDVKEKEAQFFEMFLLYGTVGIAQWGASMPGVGVAPDVEIIPPWELMPIPNGTMTQGERYGLMRYRRVPLSWVKQKSKKGGMQGGLSLPIGADAEAKMQVEYLGWGDSPTVEGAGNTESMTVGKSMDRGTTTKEDTIPYVPLTEAWLQGPGYTLGRYLVIVGKHLAYDQNFDEEQSLVPMPVALARFIPDMGFYSPGFVMMLISGNEQMEKMLQSLCRNVIELDQFGTLMWPTTAGAYLDDFKKSKGRPRFMLYEPDPTGAKEKPFNMVPTNTGDFPGRVATMMGQLQDKLASHGPLFQGQALGRVDSASGEGFAFEVSQISLAAAAHEASNAWAQMYRSMLASMKARMKADDLLELTNLDLNVAGILIGEEGKVSLRDNPLPEWYEVEVDVRDRTPRSEEKIRADLERNLQLGLIDPIDLRIKSYKEGLGDLVCNEKEMESYRKSVFMALKMFGDGQTPGVVSYNITYDDPVIVLRVFGTMASKLEMMYASEDVRTAFGKFIRFVQERLGQFPEGAPPIPEALGAETQGQPQMPQAAMM